MLWHDFSDQFYILQQLLHFLSKLGRSLSPSFAIAESVYLLVELFNASFNSNDFFVGGVVN